MPRGNPPMMRFTATFALILFACAAHGQATAAKAEFEVASIKPAPPPDGRGMRVGMRGGPGTSDPTSVVIENFNVFGLVMRAYDLKTFQVTGADMRDGDRFNIAAKVPQGATKDDLKLMLQNLLADRFKLKFHRETKEMPIFELTVGKNGLKFKESAGPPPEPDPAAPRPANRPDKDGYPSPPPGAMIMSSMNGSPRARLNAASESMPEFIVMLSNSLGRVVVDGTGLKGKYDFVLSWIPEPMNGAPIPMPPGGGSGAAPLPDEAGPTLIGAVQQQLGLKLESKKGPVEILVIEHYEKVPTEN
jgi:uncharacterized protein (TIGR03435 family)